MKYDVLIIGAGIAGLAQALALTRLGFRVAVVDHGVAPITWHQTDPWDSRVVALTRASQRLFEQFNVWSAIVERRCQPFEQMQLWWPGQLEQAVYLSAEEAAEADLGIIVEQSVVRDALWSSLKEYVDCYWEQTWQALIVSTPVSALTLSSGLVLQADLIIAADGAASPVRQYLAMGDVSWSYQARAVVATLRSEQPHQAIARQVFHPEGTLALLPLSDPHVCSLVWSVPPEKADTLLKFSKDAFCRSLSMAIDQSLGQLTLVTQPLSFPLQALCSQQFVLTGVAFIADAAHVLHPLAGQGLNLGLADVACLTEVLTTARKQQRPIGHLAVLTPYGRKRKVAAEQMILLMSALEKSGRFSAKYPQVGTRLMNLSLKRSRLLKTLTTTFALHALNQ